MKHTTDFQQIQLVGLNPNDFISQISQSVASHLEDFKKQFQPKDPESFLTRSEVAKLLKINLSTVWSWTQKGKLKSYGIGNRVYYKRSEVEARLTPLNVAK